MERRHEKRIRHPKLTARCTLPGESANLARAVLDVSSSGARLLLVGPARQGDIVTVRLEDAHGRAAHASGEIRWVRTLPSRLGCVAGLFFIRASGLAELLRAS